MVRFSESQFDAIAAEDISPPLAILHLGVVRAHRIWHPDVTDEVSERIWAFRFVAHRVYFHDQAAGTYEKLCRSVAPEARYGRK